MIKIEDYRGWEISFDIDNESFVAYSSAYDSDVKKLSYAACKKYIDDFIKENTHFKPILIGEYNAWRSGGLKVERKKVIGRRKDGKFIAETAQGKETISDYSLKGYFIWDDKYNEIFKEHGKLCEIANAADKVASDYLKENFKPVTLEEYKKFNLD